MEETWARRGDQVLVIRMSGSEEEEGARGETGDPSRPYHERHKARVWSLLKVVQNFGRTRQTPGCRINLLNPHKAL